MTEATSADDMRHALILSLRRQIELAGMMEDELMSALTPTGNAYASMCNLLEIVVTLSDEALSQAAQITFPFAMPGGPESAKP